MYRVGLTANIGCGKSLVLNILREFDVPTLDVDQVVHHLYQNDRDLIQQVEETFGPDILGEDGQIDRQKLGRLVFESQAKRKRLEGWIHPKVREAMVQFFEDQQNEPLAVIEVPLLFEGGLEGYFDEVWVVRATPEQQQARLITNKGLSESEAQSRMASQMPLTEKLTRADWIIDNTGSIEAVRNQLRLRLSQFTAKT